MNEAPSDPRFDDVFAPFTDSPEKYAIPTLRLEQPAAATFIPAEGRHQCSRGRHRAGRPP